MGCDKAMLPVFPGLSFTGYLLNSFAQWGCNPIILVVNKQVNPGSFPIDNLITVVNADLEKGRSWSIKLGLSQVPKGSACFIQNIDNPFLDQDLLTSLAGPLTPDSYAVPLYNGHGGHPVLLGSNLVHFFRTHQDFHDFRRELRHFLRIDVPFHDERILLNVNTPGDYQEFSAQNH
jgi:CTP:molybdopterin cytidylyltransferase MocA